MFSHFFLPSPVLYIPWFDLFRLLNWDGLDLYYGHKAQEMILLTMSKTPFMTIFFAENQYFARQTCQGQPVEHFDFDLTCDANNLQAKFNLVEEFSYTYGPIEKRFNFSDPTISFGDTRWGSFTPPPHHHHHHHHQ